MDPLISLGNSILFLGCYAFFQIFFTFKLLISSILSTKKVTSSLFIILYLSTKLLLFLGKITFKKVSQKL